MMDYDEYMRKQDEGSACLNLSPDIIWNRIRRFISYGAIADKDMRILSVGCRFGYEMYVLDRMGYSNLVGIDVSRRAVAVGMIMTMYDIRHDDVQHLRTIPRDSVDAVLCFHVLEHTVDIQVSLLRIREVLRDRGQLLCVVPQEAVISAYHHHRFDGIGDVVSLLSDSGYRCISSFVIDASPAELCVYAEKR